MHTQTCGHTNVYTHIPHMHMPPHMCVYTNMYACIQEHGLHVCKHTTTRAHTAPICICVYTTHAYTLHTSTNMHAYTQTYSTCTQTCSQYTTRAHTPHMDMYT